MSDQSPEQVTPSPVDVSSVQESTPSVPSVTEQPSVPAAASDAVTEPEAPAAAAQEPQQDASEQPFAQPEAPEAPAPAEESQPHQQETGEQAAAEPKAPAESESESSEQPAATPDEAATPASATPAPAVPAPTPTPASGPKPTPAHPTPAAIPPRPAMPSPAAAAPAGEAAPAVPAGPSASARFGRVSDDGTVYVRTPEGEKEVGSYPGAPAEEALAYFTRKYDEIYAVAELLFQRVTQTDLSARDAGENLAKLRESAKDLHAVGDLVALAAKIETIATAVEARKAVEHEQRSAARQEALAKREAIVAEAETIAAQPEAKIQWKSSSARMRALLDEWKAAQRGGPKLDRESEQALWHRLSSSRNSFDKLRRVHFAQLSSGQAEAKSAKEELIAQAEALATSTDWGATAGAFKALMDRWRHAGRAARSDDDALWARFKAAQDSFFNAKDAVSAAENEEFKANLVVKEELLTQAKALLPVRDLERTKAALRSIQDKWDAAGKVPRADLERIEKAMRKVEQTVREAEDKKWKRTDPEVAARAASLASQAEAALEKYRRDLEKAEKSGNAAKIAKAKEALEARQTWLEQAQRVAGATD